jgi:hypothetical protein
MLFKNPVRTSKRTQHFTITEINWFNWLFKEIIAVYCASHTKPVNALCAKKYGRLLSVEAGGTYSYHWALKG